MEFEEELLGLNDFDSLDRKEEEMVSFLVD